MHKAAVMRGVRKIRIEEVETKQPKPDELKVKVEYIGVCGSDLHFLKDGRLGNWVADDFLILGHEAGGIVEAAGSAVNGFKPGDRVAMEPGGGCGKCYYCKTGKYNLCEKMSFMAIPDQREGAFQQYVNHPADLCFKLPDNVSTLQGALVEPLSVGLHAARQSGISAGDSACILGAGCIGLVTLLVLKMMGVGPIIVSDVIPKRLEKAKELGADIVVDATKQDVLSVVMDATQEGAGFVYEAAGTQPTTLLAASLIKKGGVVTLIGMASEAILKFDVGTLMQKEARLETIFRYRNLYPLAINVIARGLLPVEKIVSHVFEFEDIENGLLYNIDNNRDVIKAVIHMS
jgi:L-iditol 2-dehydrogenase